MTSCEKDTLDSKGCQWEKVLLEIGVQSLSLSLPLDSGRNAFDGTANPNPI
jgi:hypothetical protein